MCGVAGFYNFQGHNQDEARVQVLSMVRELVHRGPDEEGVYVDGKYALGHRRLSIIDLSSGQQPLAIDGGALCIVFNGEIYNFIEIRKKLEGLGHVFRTKSDTEVILRAYKQWGKKCVARLNGMFAFAVIDQNNQSLFLARDRLGKKPLYYYHDGKTFAFASEMKAILKGGFSRKQIDCSGLDCFYSFGYIPSPLTIFSDIKKLEPATTLEVKNGVVRKQKYWSVQFDEKNSLTLREASQRLEDLLEDAVTQRLISDVPLGAFLSGGLDSTLVVSYMAGILPKPVLTNSIGFGLRELNELPIAGIVADHLRTDHREFILEPSALDVINDIAWHFDEPFADSSAIPTWYVCKMARKNVTVALSGDGGDETFGGYTFRYIPHMFESAVRRLIPDRVRISLFGILGSVYPERASLPRPFRLKTIFQNLALNDAEAFYRDLVWLQAETKKKIYSMSFCNSIGSFFPSQMALKHYMGCASKNPLSRSQNADLCFYMPEDVLVKVDRMSMAHSLEVRSPLLDYRITEFAATLPARLKIRKSQGKVLLRHLAGSKLPKVVINQPKRGFSIPVAKWLRNELKPLAREMIFEKSHIIQETLIKENLGRLWDEHQTGLKDHSVFLWGLTMLGLWEKHYY
ncbi:MAG: asparagine synthase (glutamine-hydrolyzing) [Desulfobacter sp.]|nr:MAG: asparagine synthase (glutamine-hydrolyzing) [Desulfobacter sp.]